VNDEDWDEEGDAALHEQLGSLLRESAPPAPPRLHDRAVGRIRAEREALLVARALTGALMRVAEALPDYLAPAHRRRS
jgi:hypothetical protein